MMKSSRTRTILLGLCVAVMASACSKPEQVREFVVPVFPPPPEQPRFYYEHSLISTSQVQGVDSKRRLRTALTGEVDVGQGFSKPFDVVACQGRVYVSDTVARTVTVFNFPEKSHRVLGESEPGSLAKPMGLAADGACNLYVADITNSQVTVYDARGDFLRVLPTPEIQRLTHITVDPAGTRVYAADTGGVDAEFHGLHVYDAQSGQHLRQFGGRGDAPDKFNLPKDVEYLNENLYVIDSANFKIKTFTTDGRFVGEFGKIGRNFGEFARPKGIGIDAEGNVYVSDTSHGNFQIFNPSGELLLFVGTRGGNQPAQYMLPGGIDVDEDGRVYMVDQFHRRVDVYRPAGLETEEGYLGVWSRNQVGE